MGHLDKGIRLVLAAVIIALFLFHIIYGTLAVILLTVAVVFAITGFISFCPLYFPFGINTCKKKPTD